MRTEVLSMKEIGGYFGLMW